MIKLTEQNSKNDPAEYDRIFAERAKKGPNWQDVRRWREMTRYFKGGVVTDIGCLDSQVSEHLTGEFKYMGTDVAKEAIKKMTELYPYSNRTFLVDDIYKSKIQDEVSDYTILGEVLEHLERPADAIKEAFRILKHGGVLAVSVPLEESIEPGAVDAERHLWSYTKQDVLDLVKPYAKKTKTKILRSKWFPKYKYCWPQLIVWATKL